MGVAVTLIILGAILLLGFMLVATFMALALLVILTTCSWGLRWRDPDRKFDWKEWL